MRILFFMPVAARTSGAEVALFNLIHYAADRGWDMAVAARWPGDLLEELPARVQRFVQGDPTTRQRLYAGVTRRVLRKHGGFPEMAHDKFKPDIWYVNTVVQPWIVEEAKKKGIPCVLHAHELEQVLSLFPAGRTATLVSYPRLVIACSEAARDVYRTLGRAGGMEVSYPTLNPQNISWSAEESARIRRDLGIAENTFVWTMAGGFDSNKNPLLFVELAAEMLRASLDVHFMWLGGVADNGYSLYVKEKAKALGVADKVSFVGNRTADYYDYLNAANGVVVTSSRESFSVFTAEAAYLGKPVVSFDCGGVREIVRPGMGVVIDSRNPTDLIQEMVGVMKGRVACDPRAARERVEEFFVGVQGERWVGLMQEYFAAEGQRASDLKTMAYS